MHRQADHLGSQPFAHRDAPLADRILFVRLLTMQRDRVVDCGRNAFCLQCSGQRIAPAARYLNRVLRPNRGGSGGALARHDIAKPFTVSMGNLVAGIDFVREDLELFDQDRRLDGIEPRGETDADIVVFIAPLPVHTQASEGVGNAVIVGHHRAAVAIATERLGGEKTGRRGVAKGAQAPIVVGRAKALGSIIKNEQIFGLRRGCNRAVVGRQAEQIHGNDRFWL